MTLQWYYTGEILYKLSQPGGYLGIFREDKIHRVSMDPSLECKQSKGDDYDK